MLMKNATSDFDNLMTYVERINSLNGGSSCSLFVIQNDKIVAEYYNGTHSNKTGSCKTDANSQYNVASVRKSYIGFATAYALNVGAIHSFDEPVLKYISVRKEERAVLNGVTIRHLLTHTHGIAHDEVGELIRSFSPGFNWDYNNVGIRLLTELIPNVINTSIADLLDKEIFQPLGWHETGWRSEESETLVPVLNEGKASLPLDSMTDGSQGNLFVSARELAYWGYLHLKMGKIDGQDIVPEAVIRNAITLQTPSTLPIEYPQNGCLWLLKNGNSSHCLMGSNIPNHSFEIVGFYGPLVLIVPPLNLVIVRMGNTYGNYGDDRGSYIDYLKEFSNLAVDTANKTVIH
jgi:CubicO group peptidase (beta-lactamase class C family)